MLCVCIWSGVLFLKLLFGHHIDETRQIDPINIKVQNSSDQKSGTVQFLQNIPRQRPLHVLSHILNGVLGAESGPLLPIVA